MSLSVFSLKQFLRKMNKSLRKFSRTLTTISDNLTGSITYTKQPMWIAGPPPSYGGRHIVTILPGIGIGPQMLEYVKQIFEAAHVPVDFEVIEDTNEIAMRSIKRNRVALKGHINTSFNVTLRSYLDLFVYLVHFTSYPKIKCRIPSLDIYLLRQNTEGEYAMLEHTPTPGVVESLRIITRKNSERFGKWAFEFALKKGRKKITIVHKANIMKLSDGLFLNTLLDVAKDYPELIVNDLIVDNCCMQIVTKPNTFDVILTPNLYGNVLISIICGLIGGPGLISGQNLGHTCGVFEVASRHLAFEDKKYVNPVGMLNAAVNMLFYVKKDRYASLISEAIYKTLVEQKIHTTDIGGHHTGLEMVTSIIHNIKM